MEKNGKTRNMSTANGAASSAAPGRRPHPTAAASLRCLPAADGTCAGARPCAPLRARLGAPLHVRLCTPLRGAELRALHTPVPLCQPPPRRPQSGRRARAAIAPSAFCGRRRQLHLRWLRNQAQSPRPSGTVSQPREASSEHRVPSAAWCRWLGGLGPTAGCGPPLRAPGFCRPHVCPLLLQPEGSQLPPLSPSSPCAFLALQ